MACITTMQRYEIKYLLGAREKEAVLSPKRTEKGARLPHPPFPSPGSATRRCMRRVIPAPLRR